MPDLFLTTLNSVCFEIVDINNYIFAREHVFWINQQFKQIDDLERTTQLLIRIIYHLSYHEIDEHRFEILFNGENGR